MKASMGRIGLAVGIAFAAAAGSAMAEKIALSGSNEVPPVSTQASGEAEVTVGGDCSVKVAVTVKGMTPTASHIHEAAAGVNGPVIVPFTKTGDSTFSAAPDAKFTPAQCESYKQGKTYVNVHTAANPNGEIRGQLKGN